MSLTRDQIETAIDILEKAKPTSWDLKKRALYSAWVVTSLGGMAASAYGLDYAIVHYPKSPTPVNSPTPSPLSNATNKRAGDIGMEYGNYSDLHFNRMDAVFGLSAITAFGSTASTGLSIAAWRSFEAKRVSLKTCVLDQTSRNTINEIFKSANIEATDNTSIYTLIDALKKAKDNLESPDQESKNCSTLSNCWSRLFSKSPRAGYTAINGDDIEAARTPTMDRQ